MMGGKWIAAATAAAGLIAVPAWADVERHGFYLGAGLGEFSSSLDQLEDIDINFDADDDAWKIFGGWRFNQYVAVELAYVDFGTPQTAVELFDVSADANGWAPYVVGTAPFGIWEIFARAGIMFYDVELTTNGLPGIDDSGSDFTWGVGAGVTVLERLNLRLEYERVRIDELDDAEAVWLTASWQF
jgi:opacity protein-like surface antigen